MALKALVTFASNCSIAHWYFVPGLNFQRYGIRLALSTIIGRRRKLRSLVAQALDYRISATAFLDFDFAWKAMASAKPVGTYLDYSSPWLFPAMLLSEKRYETGLLLGSDPLAMEIVRNLAIEEKHSGGDTVCKSVHDTESLKSESVDVITSLSRIAGEADDAGTLSNLWRALKPGGMLLVSVPCKGRQSKEFISGGDNSSAVSIETAIGTQRIYDESTLQQRIFSVVGEPRRYALYGESTSRGERGRCAQRPNYGSSPGHFGAIARGWQSYPSLRDLPGEGIIAMKFIKPATHQNC